MAMPLMYVSEYTDLARAYNNDSVASPMEPASRTQIITIGSSTACCEPFLPTTRFVEYHPDATCSYKFGYDNPAATTLDMRMPAGERMYKGVQAGKNCQLAVIANV